MNNPATELVIDGATLEGGGQVLRCCLSLAWLQQAPVRIHSIRAGRPKPGLANQHLAGARLSATLAGIQLEGVHVVLPGQDRVILDHVSWAVPKGRLVAIMGPSGSGKVSDGRGG